MGFNTEEAKRIMEELDATIERQKHQFIEMNQYTWDAIVFSYGRLRIKD